MREHKYRAWHKQEQKMYEVSSIYFGVQYGMGHSDRSNLVDLRDKSKSYREGEYIELMEYTGLKDKHGKEGYKDDLVKMFDRSLFQIVWNDHYARFQLELVKGEEIKKVYDMGMLQMGEIIGNIYEQPELLNE